MCLANDMTGYDKSRFINLSDIESEEYMCGICHCIFNNPVVVPCCLNMYCKACIEKWITTNSTCPQDRTRIEVRKLMPASRPFTNLLSKLEIRCEFEPRGCKSVVQLCDLSAHLEKCDFNRCDDCECKRGKSVEHDCVKNLRKLVDNLRAKLVLAESVDRRKTEDRISYLMKGIKDSYEKRLKDVREENFQLRSEQYKLMVKVRQALEKAEENVLFLKELLPSDDGSK